MYKKLIFIFFMAIIISVTGCSSDKKELKNTEQSLESSDYAELEAGKFTLNKEAFENFAKAAQEGSKGSLKLKYYENGAVLSTVELIYDGKEYTYKSTGDSDNIEEKYKYMYLFEGTYKGQYTYSDYILANDKDLTYDSLQNNIISSNLEEAGPDGVGFRYISSDHNNLQ